MKKIIALLLAVMMVLSMAACSKTDDKGGDNGATQAGDQPTLPNGVTLPSIEDDQGASITIKVWTPTEDQAEGNNWLEAMEAAFKAKYPNYSKVNFENTTMGEGDAGDAVIKDVTASADVFMFANDQLGKLVKAGGLTKLTGNIADQIKADNNDFMINTVTYIDDELYGFPVTNNTWFMYYDKTVFSEEDVKNLDTMLTKGKVYLPFGTGWTAGCIFLGCGGTIFGENGLDASAGINFGGANGYMAGKKMVELKNNPNAICGTMDVSKMVNYEANATFSGSWDRGQVEAAYGENLGVAMLPKFTIDGQEYQMTAMSGSKCVGVNPNSGAGGNIQKQAVCTLFASYLASEEAQLARYTMRGVIPAHNNLKNNEEVKKDAVAIAEMETIANASKLQSALEEMTNYWGPVENFGNKVVTGDITLETVEIGVDEMQEALNP